MDLTRPIVPSPDDNPSPAPPPQARGRAPLVVKVLGVVMAVLLVAAITGAFVKVPYFLLSPGSARPTEGLIQIEGTETFEHPGDVEFATVSLQHATAMQALMGWLDPTVDVVEEKVILGDNSQEENRAVNLKQMSSSKEVATAVALTSMGYEVTTTGTGSVIVHIEPGSAAEGVLAVGDVVVQADGQVTDLSSEFVEVIGGHAPGDVLDLLVERGGEGDPVPVSVTLGANPRDPGRAFLGVSTSTRGLQYQFPFTVTIDSGEVGGPSAGLAFTLGVIDTLSPESLTAGRRIATTGTISPDGKVGPVGGVSQKTVAVRRSGAELFLVPSSEYDQAREFAGDMQVVSVDTLDQALAALETFRAGVQPVG